MNAVEAAARALNPLAWVEHDRMEDAAGEPSPELVVERSVTQATSALAAALPHLTEGLAEVCQKARDEAMYRFYAGEDLEGMTPMQYVAAAIEAEMRRRIEG